jgi:hypothetical protein
VTEWGDRTAGFDDLWMVCTYTCVRLHDTQAPVHVLCASMCIGDQPAPDAHVHEPEAQLRK